MYEMILRYYPFMADQITDWRQCGPTDAYIELDDGTAYMFDCNDGSITRVRSKSERIGMDDATWSKEFSFRLRRMAKLRYMTNIDIADATGLSSVIISNYMNGKAMPKANNVIRLAEALGCSVDYLMCQSDIR